MPTSQVKAMLQAIDKDMKNAKKDKKTQMKDDIKRKSKGAGHHQNKQKVLENQRKAQQKNADELANMLYKMSLKRK